MEVRVDNAELRRKLEAHLRGAGPARQEATRSFASRVMQEYQRIGHVDTGRDARAWAMANNGAGLPPVVLPPLRRAKWLAKMSKVLQSNVSFWTYVVRTEYVEKGRADKWYQRAEQRRLRAVREAEKFAQAQRDGNGAIIAFNLFGGTREPSVRTRIYGGRGFVLGLGRESRVVLHNLEAHATVVQQRFRTLAQCERAALDAVGGGGSSVFERTLRRLWSA